MFVAGLPKPIVWTLGYAAVAANAYLAQGPEDHRSVSQLYRHEFVLSAMPMFHVSFLHNLLSSLGGTIPIS